MNKDINVTSVFLPPREDYERYLRGIWKRDFITNHGPLVFELERKLKHYLGVRHLFAVTNGTLALQIAIKALDLRGEIITTPFSYVATTSSIVWSGLKPVFADIEPDTLTINPNTVAETVTKKTSGVIATHIYGNPCDVKALGSIARKHRLKIIYDAAHAFGVRYRRTPIGQFGDITIFSFHATKLFHTIEGGALATNDDRVAHTIAYMRNFGHKTPEQFWGVGINGKMNEFQAAMGLCMLPRVSRLISIRKNIHRMYRARLAGSPVAFPAIRPETTYNFAYFPIILESRSARTCVQNKLNEQRIFPRRYFYPSLNTLSYVQSKKQPIAQDISDRVLCLPLAHTITERTIGTICRIIKQALNH